MRVGTGLGVMGLVCCPTGICQRPRLTSVPRCRSGLVSQIVLSFLLIPTIPQWRGTAIMDYSYSGDTDDTTGCWSCNRDYSVIHLSVFHRMRSSTPVKAMVTSTPATMVNIQPTLQLLSSADAEEFLLSLPDLYWDPDLTPRGKPGYGLLSTCIRPTGVC